MDLITITAIAVGLAMDAFAVSVVSGVVYERLHVGHVFRMAVFFGGFQAFMPLIGFWRRRVLPVIYPVMTTGWRSRYLWGLASR